MADIRPGSIDSAREPLTTREQEILQCLGEGLTNREIAHRLYLAENTVRWYNSQIYSKLAVGSRDEAVERAQALGLLDISSNAPNVVHKHNLPAQATPFVGRRDELDELAVLLDAPDTRLVTILAPGGMGKTRLALQAAHLQVGHYADGVYFVPLAPLSSSADLVTAIAENIGFNFYGANTPAQQLIDFLYERSLLLVLDNFEHLLDGASLVADLIQATPGIRVLTTSRERLNLRGETVYVLRGLDFPGSETGQNPLEYAAIKLFMQSARRVRPNFAIQVDKLDYLARICRLTGGMPLGIELAAGWVDVLSLEKIAAEIQRGLDILETDLRDVPERQRSLRATFERTWERLSDDEQRVFMRLSVFRGGFTFEAASAVADADVRALRKLANKALVQVASDGRHDIHELLRQYGVEKLAASDNQPQIEARHAAFFAAFMTERKQDIRTDRQLEALELIDSDFENVRVAWLHTIDQQAWDALPKFLHCLWFYLDVRTRGGEAVALLEYALSALQSALSPEATELALARGRILARLGWFYNDIGLSEKATDACDEAVQILRQHDSPDDYLAALHEQQVLSDRMGRLDLDLSCTLEGLQIARTMGDKYWEAQFLLWAGFLSTDSDHDLAGALQFAKETLAVFEGLGDRWGLMMTYHLLGQIYLGWNEYEVAKQWFRREQPLVEAFGHLWSSAHLYMNQAKIARLGQRYADALPGYTKGLKLLWNSGYRYTIPYILTRFALIFTGQNEFEKAVEILATLWKYPLAYGGAHQIAQDLRDELRTKLEAERYDAAWVLGEARELSALVAELVAEFEEM